MKFSKEKSEVKMENEIQRPASSCSSVSSDGLETYKVTTCDGYILTLVRLIKVGDCESYGKNGKPVLLIPGLLNGGLEWLELGDEKSLPSMLIKAGYDCWMGCIRGTSLSQSHIKLKSTSRKFWDFSMDEISKYDLPAFIDYVLKVNGSKDLFYCGYSMGGAMIMAMLDLKPEFTDKIIAISCLAPGVYGHSFSTKFNKFFIPVTAYTMRRLKFVYSRPAINGTVEKSLKKVFPSFLRINRAAIGAWIINTFGKLSGAIVSDCRTDKEMFKRIAKIMPVATSIKNVVHIASCFNSNKFHAFDYGSKERNRKHYGTSEPPLYDLGKITVPVATFTAAHDRLVPAKDVEKTSKELPNLIFHHTITSPRFAHCDFLFGKDADKLVYKYVIEVFDKFSISQADELDITSL